VGAKARDLIAVAEEVAADLVLRDATDVAATVAAEVVGLPLAVYSVSHYLPVRVWRRLAGRTLQAVRAEHGLDADSGLARLTSTPYFDVMPPMLQVPATMELSAHHVVRYESRDDSPAEARHDDGLAAGSPASAVLASFGTVFNDRARLWRTVLGALTELDVPVVATGGSDRVQALAASVGGKVRVAGYAPHSRLLPGCRVLVCHGGFNTMMGAICAGVPMVCLPMAGDQYYNAEMVARFGLGFRLSSSRVSQRELRAAVIELLADPAYATRVREVRDSMTSLPPAASVVAVLERLGRR
jgi:UDP:flavonoid glycosyltransferase YjiC (YdhE family)